MKGTQNWQMQLKSVDEEQRIITGIASTSATDRDGDIVEPGGAVFVLPIPFLWQHKRDQPIGEVIEAEITDAGVEVTVKIAKVEEEGKLKERIDEAWQSIKTGLVKGLSVGFRGRKYNFLEKGIHYQEWDWLELSAVTIPANQQSKINTVKAEGKTETGLSRHLVVALDTQMPAESRHMTVRL